MPLAQARCRGDLIPAKVDRPGAVEIFGLQQHRGGRIQGIQHVELVLAAEIADKRAAFGRREGTVVDQDLGNLPVVADQRLVGLRASKAIAMTALVADGRVSRGNRFSIRSQGVAQSVLHRHGGGLAGRLEHDDREAAIGHHLQGRVEIDRSVLGGGPPANITARGITLGGRLKRE